MRITIHAEDLSLAEAASALEVDGPATVGDAARLLTLKRTPGLIILVNGRLAEWGTALHDGDVVELIPALGGG